MRKKSRKTIKKATRKQTKDKVMGAVRTPKYRLELSDAKGTHTQSWHGKATDKRLGEYIDSYIRSLKSGGANQHLSKSYGFLPIPNKAKIVEQSSGKVVVNWQAPAFMEI